VPAVRVEVVHVATALVNGTPVQPVMAVPSDVKSTVPVGVPEPGNTADTVAVNFTDWPTLDGFTDEVRTTFELA